MTSTPSIQDGAGTRPPLPAVVMGTMWKDVLEMTVDDARHRVDVALHEGLDAFDTAPIYGFGRAEELLGRAVRGRRERVLLLGKVGLRWDGDHGDVMFREQRAAHGQVTVRKDSRPISVRRDVDDSLERLGVEHIDLVQVHQRDHHTPLEETLGELMRLRDEGKLRWIGVSNFDARDTRRSAQVLGASGLVTNQLGYSLLSRGVEREIVPVLDEVGAGLLAYSPTGSGLLGGATLATRAGSSRYVTAVQQAVRTSLAPVAADLGISVAQLAIAWVIQRPTVSAAIVGARTDEHIVEAAAASRVILDKGTADSLAAAVAGVSPGMDLGPLSRAKHSVRRVTSAIARRLRPRPGRD